MQEKQSGSIKLETSESDKPSADWLWLLWGLVFGASYSSLKTRMDLPAPLSMGIAALLAQLIFLVIPVKRREYKSLRQWVRVTMIFAAASAFGVYIIERFF